jgi:hypothetical protein
METDHRRHALAMLTRELVPGLRRSPFDALPGTDREVAFAVTPLPALHNAARTLAGATLNDAVLAVVAGGLRRWLHGQHGPVHRLRVKVPVCLHTEGDAAGCLAFPKHSATQMRWGVMRDKAAALGVAPAGVRIHDLRHSRITYLVEAGGNIVGISRMAGHSTVQFTLDRYSHVRDDVARGLAFL